VNSKKRATHRRIMKAGRLMCPHAVGAERKNYLAAFEAGVVDYLRGVCDRPVCFPHHKTAYVYGYTECELACEEFGKFFLDTVK